LDGLHFRRQVPIGPYIADFVFGARMLVIEVDGETHTASQAYNAVRSEYLEERGWRVLRFWNNEVMQNIEGVIVSISEALQRPLPNAPPRAGEGRRSR
jgi:very-short-patch-repair endonuclease